MFDDVYSCLMVYDHVLWVASFLCCTRRVALVVCVLCCVALCCVLREAYFWRMLCGVQRLPPERAMCPEHTMRTQNTRLKNGKEMAQLSRSL
jgi:hypothetical protein